MYDLLPALRIYYSVHSADENTDVQRRRPQGSEGKERIQTHKYLQILVSLWVFLLLKF